MSEEIKEIGIEKECFLLKNGEIMEPKLFGFPRDEFEFLVELRSLPSDRLYPVYLTLHQEELQYKLRANKFGMNLHDFPNMHANSDWVQRHWEKYNLAKYNDLDYTKNIYSDKDDYPLIGIQSHHLGVLDTDDNLKKRLTAGIHIHFSSRDAETGNVIDLPIEEIVEKMDLAFEHYIIDTNRNLGEWEPKAHGFEYRSLPCNVDTYKVLKNAFKILREV